MLEGDWPAARDFSDRGLALHPREPRNLAIRTLMEFQLGASDEGEAYLARLLDPARFNARGLWEEAAVAVFVPLIGRVTGREGQLDFAATCADAALSTDTRPPFIQHFWPRIGLGFLAVRRGDAAATAERHAWLEHQRGTAVLGLGLAVDRLLGLLALATAQFDTAFAHFEDALAFCDRAGYRPEYAWSAADYAGALLEHGTTGDRDRAASLFDEALPLAGDLGMRPLLERIESLRLEAQI